MTGWMRWMSMICYYFGVCKISPWKYGWWEGTEYDFEGSMNTSMLTISMEVG